MIQEVPVKISVRKIMTLLGGTIIVLTTLGVLSQIYRFEFGNGQERYITKMLNLDEEYNFPTLYATLALFFCSLLLFTISSAKKAMKDRFSKHWFALGIIFLLLGTDEILVLHEQLSWITNSLLKTSTFLRFSWIIPGIIFVIVFVISYIKFLIDLPSKYRNLFILSGAVYILGAIGMELIGDRLFLINGSENLFYALLTQVEELTEMLGVLLFSFTLLSYVKTCIGHISISVTD
jgi:uncharacterized membrane protein